MKRKFVTQLTSLALMLTCFILGSELKVCANGIPEPGFIMYGVLSNSTGGGFLVPGNVEWQISSTSSSVSVNASLINVNGQNFYLAVIPFETRFVAGISLGAPTPNTLPLNSSVTMFARQATMSGTNANVIYASSGSPNSFNFGPADRGRVERVDLSVAPPTNFGQWLAQYGLPANSDPNSDPTHKGLTLTQQYVANLNPNDPTSTFKFLGIQPSLQSVQLQWLSTPGEVYAVAQGNSLAGSFSLIQSNIVATPGTNTFAIPMPTNSAPLFLRVVVQQGN